MSGKQETPRREKLRGSLKGKCCKPNSFLPKLCRKSKVVISRWVRGWIKVMAMRLWAHGFLSSGFVHELFCRCNLKEV